MGVFVCSIEADRVASGILMAILRMMVGGSVDGRLLSGSGVDRRTLLLLSTCKAMRQWLDSKMVARIFHQLYFRHQYFASSSGPGPLL